MLLRWPFPSACRSEHLRSLAGHSFLQRSFSFPPKEGLQQCRALEASRDQRPKLQLGAGDFPTSSSSSSFSRAGNSLSLQGEEPRSLFEGLLPPGPAGWGGREGRDDPGAAQVLQARAEQDDLGGARALPEPIAGGFWSLRLRLVSCNLSWKKGGNVAVCAACAKGERASFQRRLAIAVVRILAGACHPDGSPISCSLLKKKNPSG